MTHQENAKPEILCGTQPPRRFGNHRSAARQPQAKSRNNAFVSWDPYPARKNAKLVSPSVPSCPHRWRRTAQLNSYSPPQPLTIIKGPPAASTVASPAMAVPRVVIVGRPNVGKSSLLNWLAGLRLAIVDDRPGVTRDRVEYLMSHEDRYFELVDTGGMGNLDEDNLTKHVEEQIQTAIDAASVILFVVDTKAGLTPLDEEVGHRLRNLDVPVLCVANKADDPKLDDQAADFYRLGRGKIVPVSTKQNRNRSVLLNLILERLPAEG